MASTTETTEIETTDIQAKDNHVLHPWDALAQAGRHARTVISRSEGVYVYDSDGNRLIDGPAGMWCVNLGHGCREIADAAAEQMRKMPYYSPWNLANAPAAQLAAKLIELAPGDINHVFFTTCGSTAVDSALRFAMFFNNVIGRPDKKHIISRQDAYHGSTYLGASCSGKERDKSYFDFEQGFVHLLSSPNPYRRPGGMSVEAFRDSKAAELESKILSLGPDQGRRLYRRAGPGLRRGRDSTAGLSREVSGNMPPARCALYFR